MHVRESVELGAILACHGSLFIRRAGAVRPKTVEQYWVASKCRLGHWTRALKDYQVHSDNARNDGSQRAWTVVRSVIEEILATELLSRVWSGLTCGWDQRHEQAVFDPLVRSVFQGHLEARNRALNIMVYGCGFRMEEAVSLNHLRRRIERWTDMLLAYVTPEYDAGEFAFDAKRMRDFSDDLQPRSRLAPDEPTRQVVLASLRLAFRTGLHRHSPNAELNRRIASSILSCLDEDLFEASGLLRSLWVERLYCTTNETQGMIDELLWLDAPSGAPRTLGRLPRF